MNALFLHENAEDKSQFLFWSYTFPAMPVIVKIYKKYESLAKVYATTFTNFRKICA